MQLVEADPLAADAQMLSPDGFGSRNIELHGRARVLRVSQVCFAAAISSHLPSSPAISRHLPPS